MLKRLSAYFCYWELMFPPCGTPNLLPAFIKYSVFGFAFQACVWQVFMCACVALRFQWPYSSSAWSLIQVEARDCVTFPPQVTERAEGPEGRERRRLTKWKKKKKTLSLADGGIPCLSPSDIFLIVAAELHINFSFLKSHTLPATGERRGGARINKHDDLLQ